MDSIQIVPVDERDSSWEDGAPRFRVYLHAGGPTKTGDATATYDVTGADVLQVIDWAQRRVAGTDGSYAVALVRDDVERGRGLVWLVGIDGNTNPWDAREEEQLARMLARRAQPVRVGPGDRMPSGVEPR